MAIKFLETYSIFAQCNFFICSHIFACNPKKNTQFYLDSQKVSRFLENQFPSNKSLTFFSVVAAASTFNFLFVYIGCRSNGKGCVNCYVKAEKDLIIILSASFLWPNVRKYVNKLVIAIKWLHHHRNERRIILFLWISIFRSFS